MRPVRHDRGQIIALFAFAVLAIGLLMGLVVDGGFAWVKRREVQNGADFAALAGVRIIMQNAQGTARTDGDVATAIVNAAQANGSTVPSLGTASGPLYTDGLGIPLTPTSYVGATTSTAAIPSTARGLQVPGFITWHPFIIGAVGINSWSAGAQATARFATGSSPCGICILAGAVGTNSINITANNATIHVGGSFGASNSSSIVANNGSIIVDGNLGGGNSQTITSVGGSIIVGGNLTGTNSTAIKALSGTISVNGNLNLSSSTTAKALAVNVQGSVSITSSSSVTPSPPTSTGAVIAPISDPLASLSNPTNPNPGATPQSYKYTGSQTCSFSPGSGIFASVSVANSSTATLIPGLYSQISVTNSSKVNLQPGTYYIAGTGGNMTADSSSKIVGLGAVTLVFLDQTTLTTANSTGLQITAPSPSQSPSATYPWPGVAIYAARGNTGTFSVANSSGTPLIGAIYARDATLTTANSSPVAVQSLVVVGSYKSASSSSLSVTYDATQNPIFASGGLSLVQ